MADLVGGAVLSSFLSVAFDRMSSPEVVNWIKGKKLDKLLATLKTSLYAAQALLNDAEKKQIKDKAVKDWLGSLKDAVYKADDLLDEVSTKAATQKDPGNFLSRYLNLKDREIASRMEDIIDTLESILKHKDALGLKEIPKEDMSWRVTTSLVKMSDIYGRDKDKDAITKLLLDDTSDGEISVIPIVGQGGIGKTTLAQLVYNDDRVKNNFDFRAWVCVSEEFDVIKVTRTIVEALTRGPCHTNELNLLQQDLAEKLSRQKFLIVLDDAWNENYGEWIKLLKPFQHGIKGSKILITTRSRKVVSMVQTVSPHEISLLSYEDCWLVFAKHALLSTDSREYPILEKIGREVVNRCNGLPLAAQTLGGLLRGNHDVRYWNLVLKSDIWEFAEGSSQIVSALRISYYYLPPHLKECFVFCSLYPKDYEFSKSELILLWIAENFIEAQGRKTLEEVGSEYFDELVARSFFQPDHTRDGVFVMHDLMHDLAILNAKEFYFRADDLEDAVEIGFRTRHLSHNAIGNYPMSKLLAACDDVKYTRTFLEVNSIEYLHSNMENPFDIILSQMKYLRVFSFREYFPLESLPDTIGELIHLRYLDISETSIVTLPETLCNLYNLQTLKLAFCSKLEMLPAGMQELVNLRHLEVRGTSLKEMPKGMSKLKHLQFLSDFVVGKHEENGISELGALTNLHGSLEVNRLENVSSSGEALKAGMADKKHIVDLVLCWRSDGNFLDSQIEREILENLRPHEDLISLLIGGYRGTRFSDWLGNCSYHNMTKLVLEGCSNCCRLPSLGQLPSLKSLFISLLEGLEIIGDEFYKSEESCPETPFPSLESLTFRRMPCWREWHSFKLDDPFPRLKELLIYDCPLLTGDLPNSLPALELLEIHGCQQLACSLPRDSTNLRIDIRYCDVLRIQELPLSLSYLIIIGSQVVESALEAMTRTKPTCLQNLCISSCDSAMPFPWDSLPSSLRSLTIIQYKKLFFPTEWTNAPKLESLEIHDCPEVDSFPGGILHPSLKSLVIGKCEKLMRWLTMIDLRSHGLTRLVIEGPYETITSFPKEGWLPASLEQLTLRGLQSLETLDCRGFLHLTSFQELTIRHCPNMKNIVGESLPASLTLLHVQLCPLLGESCHRKDPQIWPKISHITAIKVDYQCLY